MSFDSIFYVIVTLYLRHPFRRLRRHLPRRGRLLYEERSATDDCEIGLVTATAPFFMGRNVLLGGAVVL